MGSQQRELFKLWRRFALCFDPRNRTEYALAALKPGPDEPPRGPDDPDELDMVAISPIFAKYLDEIHFERDTECADWLATHAYRIEKMVLAKYSTYQSRNILHGLHSLFKFDHSQRHPISGERQRERESMAESSKVNAPALFDPTAMAARSRAELGEHETARREERRVLGGKNTQSEDHKASGVRDLPPALRVARKRLNGSVSGAVLFFGTWLMVPRT